MRRQQDPRDRLIDAALALERLQVQIRDLTRRMKSHRCSRPDDPCWAYGEPGEVEETYCAACQKTAALARERFLLRRQRAARRASLFRAAHAFRGTIYGAAVAAREATA